MFHFYSASTFPDTLSSRNLGSLHPDMSRPEKLNQLGKAYAVELVPEIRVMPTLTFEDLRLCFGISISVSESKGTLGIPISTEIMS